MRRITPIEVRFWAKVQRPDGEGCWIWAAARHRFGYGWLSAGRRGSPPLLAHRVSWGLHFGEIPDGLSVLHSCDNPSCVRPDHLFLGTHDDNMADMASKGRWTPRQTIAPEKRARGARVATAKLTESDVREIRTRYAAGGVTMANLADCFQVTSCTVYNVISRKRWAHVA